MFCFVWIGLDLQVDARMNPDESEPAAFDIGQMGMLG